MMRLGLEKTIRQIVQLVGAPEGLAALRHRAVGLCIEPGATLDAMVLKGQTRHADAATTGLYLLPATATLIAALLRLDLGGILAAMTADLLAVGLLPTAVGAALPGLCLLFDVEAERNTYRWRTFLSHALVPGLVATAAARLLAPFSWTIALMAVLVGYVATARLFYLCCDDWVSVPEDKRGVATALVMACLAVLAMASALFFRAGLLP